VSEIIPLGRPERGPTEIYPRLKPLDIIGRRGGWVYARGLGMYPELEWSYSILTQRTWMLSSQVPAFFYEPLTEFDQVREVASLGRELQDSRKGVLDVSVGFRYFDRFYRTTSGRLELPGPQERLRGRHWVNVGGVVDADQLHFRNSWGEEWGDRGFGYLSREYFDAHLSAAMAAWPSDTGASAKMIDCLEAADREDLREDHWVECWPTPNEFWVDGMLIDGVLHSTVSWAVRSFETGRPVYVCELRNPTRVVARLHLHGRGRGRCVLDPRALRRAAGQAPRIGLGARGERRRAGPRARRGDDRGVDPRSRRSSSHRPGVTWLCQEPRLSAGGVGSRSSRRDQDRTKGSELMSEPGRVILDPTNPLDFERAELEELAAELGGEVEGAEVSVHLRDEHGYGGPLPEVLIIWIGIGGFSAATLATWTLVEKVGKFLQGRWKREAEVCEPDEKPRKRSASFVDVDGKPLLTVQVDLPHGEIEEVDDTAPPGRPYPGGDEGP
jgi:hypothetical protein